MRRVSFAVLLVLFSAGVVYPCGDKLALMNRGVRMQRALGARKPASIVIYTGGGMRAADVQILRTGLSRGGHRIEVAGTRAELSSILAQSPHELVLAAAPDVTMVESSIADATPRPLVMRVLQNPGKQEWRQEVKRCPLVIRTAGDSIEQLAAVDGALLGRNATADGCAR